MFVQLSIRLHFCVEDKRRAISRDRPTSSCSHIDVSKTSATLWRPGVSSLNPRAVASAAGNISSTVRPDTSPAYQPLGNAVELADNTGSSNTTLSQESPSSSLREIRTTGKRINRSQFSARKSLAAVSSHTTTTRHLHQYNKHNSHSWTSLWRVRPFGAYTLLCIIPNTCQILLHETPQP